MIRICQSNKNIESLIIPMFLNRQVLETLVMFSNGQKAKKERKFPLYKLC